MPKHNRTVPMPKYKEPKLIVEKEPTKSFGGEQLTVMGFPPKTVERYDYAPMTKQSDEEPGITKDNDDYRKQENKSRHSSYRK